jgi:hypothetical protein
MMRAFNSRRPWRKDLDLSRLRDVQGRPNHRAAVPQHDGLAQSGRNRTFGSAIAVRQRAFLADSG